MTRPKLRGQPGDIGSAATRQAMTLAVAIDIVKLEPPLIIEVIGVWESWLPGC